MIFSGAARNVSGGVLLSERSEEMRAPKARSSSRLGGLRERRKLPQRGLRRSPSRHSILEHLTSNGPVLEHEIETLKKVNAECLL